MVHVGFGSVDYNCRVEMAEVMLHETGNCVSAVLLSRHRRFFLGCNHGLLLVWMEIRNTRSVKAICEEKRLKVAGGVRQKPEKLMRRNVILERAAMKLVEHRVIDNTFLFLRPTEFLRDRRSGVLCAAEKPGGTPQSGVPRHAPRHLYYKSN